MTGNATADQLRAAAQAGDVDEVRALLEPPKPASTHSAMDDRLRAAAQAGDVAEIRAFLEGGGDVRGTDWLGMTALHWAAYRGHAAAVEALLAGGGAVRARDRYGRTALHCAAAWDRCAAIRALLAGGADVDARNHNGETPRDSAVRRGRRAAAALLDPDAPRAAAAPPADAGAEEGRWCEVRRTLQGRGRREEGPPSYVVVEATEGGEDDVAASPAGPADAPPS